MGYTKDGVPFVSKSDTSRRSSERITLRQWRTQQGRVMSDLLVSGPSTDEEMQYRLRWPGNSQRPARVACMDKGWVEKVGERKTRSGNAAAVWGITPKYIEQCQAFLRMDEQHQVQGTPVQGDLLRSR